MTATQERPAAAEQPALAAPRRLASAPVLLALLTVLAGVVAGTLYLVPQPPGEDSAAVGFARDMSRHHAQAVSMAETLRNRTDEPELRTLAADITLTQQGQIGIMSGWLGAWGRPLSGSGASMAWTGMPTDGLMPGMATAQESAALATLPLEQAENAFLRLMVAHHTGGVAMAQAGVELSDRPEVQQLASGIAAAQSSEIEYLQSLLAARGQPPAPVPELAGHDSAAAGGHDGAAAGLRDVVLLTLVALALIAALWLLVDNGLRQAGVPARRLPGAAWVAGGAATLSACLHIVLAPEHAAESAAYGLFFVLTGVALAAGAAVLLAGAARTGGVVVAGTSLLLVVTYVLFRVVPPPGAGAPEGVDGWGLTALAAEVVALAAVAVLMRGIGGDHQDAAGRPLDLSRDR